MEYQGVQYTVVQTINPFGWKWSFEREGKPLRTGIAYDRIEAIRAVERAIGQALREKRDSR